MQEIKKDISVSSVPAVLYWRLLIGLVLYSDLLNKRTPIPGSRVL